MTMAERATLTAEVRLIEFPYFLTETWRKIGQKGNALGEVFWMAAAVVRQAFQGPGIGLPLERGEKGERKKMEREERRGKRTRRTRSRLTQAETETTTRQPRGQVPRYVLTSHARLSTVSQLA